MKELIQKTKFSFEFFLSSHSVPIKVFKNVMKTMEDLELMKEFNFEFFIQERMRVFAKDELLLIRFDLLNLHEGHLKPGLIEGLNRIITSKKTLKVESLLFVEDVERFLTLDFSNVETMELQDIEMRLDQAFKLIDKCPNLQSLHLHTTEGYRYSQKIS